MRYIIIALLQMDC